MARSKSENTPKTKPAKTVGRHLWSKEKCDTSWTWTCRACGVTATTGLNALGPSSWLRGRTYNGVKLPWNGVIPKCLGAGVAPIAPSMEPSSKAAGQRKYETAKSTRVDIAYCRSALNRALGAAWVNSKLQTPATTDTLDDGQELEVLRLYAALRVHDLDAIDYIEQIKTRFADMRREALDEMAVAIMSSGTDPSYAPRGRRYNGPTND